MASATNSYHSISFRWGRHLFPAAVWLGVLMVVIGLFRHRTERFEVLGLAQGETRQIASTYAGRLKSVPVELFDPVAQGQVVAVLDGELVKAQIATVSGEIDRLHAKLTRVYDAYQADAANRQTDYIATGRQFKVNLERTRLGVLELRAQIETDRIIREDLALNVEMFRKLLGQDAISAYDVRQAELKHSVLVKKIQENEQVLVQAMGDLAEAQRRHDEFAQHVPDHPSADIAVETIRKAMQVQEKRIEELSIQRASLVLRCPFDGVVIQIHARVGEATLAGAAIMTIAGTKPSEIIAYARENQLAQIREGQAIEIIKTSGSAELARSQVIRVSTNLVEMPARLWRNPNLPQWGRPFLIKIPPNLILCSGEMVGIRRI